MKTKSEENLKEIISKIDASLGLHGYEDYIESNLGEAIEVYKNHGSMFDLDGIVQLKLILGFNVSYDLYSYIDSSPLYEDISLMELEARDYDDLIELCKKYIDERK